MKKDILEITPNEKFVMNVGDINLINEQGEIMSSNEQEEFIKKINEILVVDELSEGDVVKIKNYDYYVEVIGRATPPFKYLGKVIVLDEEVVFNQENIEIIIGRTSHRK